MDLVPENLGGAVVLNAVQSCPAFDERCGACEEYAGSIRNWLLTHEVPYLIVDLQDEKEVCAQFLIELVGLRRRLRCPFYFVGVMNRARAVLDTFNIGLSAPILQSAVDAVEHLRQTSPELLLRPLSSGIQFGEVIPVARSRGLAGIAGPEAPAEATTEDF